MDEDAPETKPITRRKRRKPLDEKRRMTAQLYVQGCTLQEIADRLPKTRNGKAPPRQFVWSMLQEPAVQEHVARLSRALEDQLHELEYEAVPVARELLYDPDPDIRYKTYTDLLNRMGRRGKPVERVLAAPITLQGDVNQYINNVLADPGVKAILDQKPELRQKLLPAPDAEV